VFWVFVFAKGALRDLRYFSLTKNPRLVKKNCSSPQISALTRKSINLENVKNTHYIHDFVSFWIQYHVILCFEFLFLLKALCGISDIFPWQRIWDLSIIIAAPQKYLLSQENREIHKSDIKHTFIRNLVQFHTQYHVILSFEFLCLMKVFCGVSDIFPWQRIWDLSKKISAPQKYLLSQENRKIHKSDKNMHLFTILYDFVHNITLFWVLSFWVFSRDVHLLQNIQKLTTKRWKCNIFDVFNFQPKSQIR